MNSKEEYHNLCETEGSQIPLFLQYWWLETVCFGKHWDVLLCRDNQGAIVGALPFLIGRKYGLRYILQPQLTQFSGPWLRNFGEQGNHQVLSDLVAQLETLCVPIYIQQFSPQITNWLPFYWKGFRQTTHYSYRISLEQTPEQMFNAFSSKERQKFRQADSKLHTTMDISPEEFATFHQRHWQSKGEEDVLSEDFILRVCHSAMEHNSGLIYGLRDTEDHLVAAWFVVYDDQCAYSLMSALNSQYPIKGATTCLVFHLLQEMKKRTKIFDFEGSMDYGVEQSVRYFGAQQIPYFKVTKFRPRWLGVLFSSWSR